MDQGIDYRALGFWFQVAQFIGYVLLGIYVWLSNRDKATTTEIRRAATEIQNVKTQIQGEIKTLEKEQGDRCGKHLKRTTVLEGSVKGLPTHRDLGEMYDKINGVKSTVDEISGSMTGVVFQLKLLVKHHLKGGDS